jgi:hypothetical protein
LSFDSIQGCDLLFPSNFFSKIPTVVVWFRNAHTHIHIYTHLDINKIVRARRNRRVSFAVQNLSEEFSAEISVPEESRFEMEVISEGFISDVSQIERDLSLPDSH